MIRHAVGIDERRAKFRQDLVEKMIPEPTRHPSFKVERLWSRKEERENGKGANGRSGQNGHTAHHGLHHLRFSGSHERLPTVAGDKESVLSMDINTINDDHEEDSAEQDIEEVWFPGAHGDIGGGWDLPAGEEPLSHGPLVWMVSRYPLIIIRNCCLILKQVREARRAGVVFDKQRMIENNCFLDECDLNDSSLSAPGVPAALSVPTIEVSADFTASTLVLTKLDPRQYLLNSCTRGRIHDCLLWPEGGLTLTGTIGWRMMEYLPFRRMDLQSDGTWRPISWPLPRGEVRDIPDNVTIHNSVIRRMQADPNYRPGNLIVGGGGRGVKKAPKSAGIGEWVVLREEGSLVGEVLGKSNFMRGKVKVKNG